MIGLIGICQTAPSFIQEHVDAFCTERGLKWQLVKGEAGGKKGRDVLLYLSYESLAHDLYRQKEIKGVAIVFDTPECLKRLTPIVFVEDIDCYSVDQLDAHTFLAELERLVEGCQTIDVKVTPINTLASLIARNQQGKMLHLYNRVIFSATGGRRDGLKKTILRYLFGDLTKPKFQTEIAPLLTRGATGDHFTALWGFLETDDGTRIMRVLREIKRRRFNENIDYAQLKAKHSTDEFEMQFLSRAYCDAVLGKKSS